jgi:hypothetical protein
MPLIIDLLEDGLILFRWGCDLIGFAIVAIFVLALIIKR